MPDWQVLSNQPLIRVESRDRLLRGSNEVFVVLGVAINNLVELFVKLLQLSRLRHVVLQHELRGLQRRVSSLIKKLQSVVDQGLVQEDTPFPQEVATVSDNLDSSFRIITVQSSQNLMM